MPQPVIPSRLRLGIVLAALAASGCGALDSGTRSIAGVFRPYRVEVVQGNFVSSEQVALLRPGMSRLQVRELLGSPLLASVFHEERWDYVFTLRRQGVEPQQRRLTVYFKGDELARFEGDPMPSEAEFVASIDSKARRSSAPVPVLEATPEQLERLARPAAPPAAANPAPLPPSYPPLEPTGR